MLTEVRPDIAILALSGRPNVDGEPYQGSLADFLIGQVDLIRPRHVILCHHDALLPPVMPAVDTTAALARLAADAPYATHVDLPLCQPTTITW